VVRPKIIALLTKRLSENLEHLSLNQLANLALNVDAQTRETLKLGDFILSKAEMLTEQDL
jgi:hypothetical protein